MNTVMLKILNLLGGCMFHLKNINILIKVRVQFLLMKQYIYFFQFSMSHIFIAVNNIFDEKILWVKFSEVLEKGILKKALN